MLGSKAFEPNRDIYSPNRNIAPISSEINESEKLVVGGCQLSELAAKNLALLFMFLMSCHLGLHVKLISLL